MSLVLGRAGALGLVRFLLLIGLVYTVEDGGQKKRTYVADGALAVTHGAVLLAGLAVGDLTFISTYVLYRSGRGRRRMGRTVLSPPPPARAREAKKTDARMDSFIVIV